jgi:transposase
MTLTRSQFENLYKKESDSKVKERLFLVMKVEGDGIVPACVAKDIHRSRTWASDWLARYHKEGIAGLKDRPKSGRPSELSSEVILRIKKILKESKQGWTTKQVNSIVVREGSVHNIITITYIGYYINGALNRRYQEKYT